VTDLPVASLFVALGIGLLVGAERERRKGEGLDRGVAGVRTFAVTALLGAVCQVLGGELLLAVLAVGVAALSAVTVYAAPAGDRGLTTEVALMLTLLLGALAVRAPELAAGLGVALAVLLAFKAPLHHFVKSVITERELDDALILAAASLVILPLLPDRHMGPFEAINPSITWTIVVLIMLVSALGHVASRVLGPRLGLPAAGFASGFVSSTATIAAMGGRAAGEPLLARHAASAAVMSSVATVVQLSLVLAVTSPAVLRSLAVPLLLAGLAAAAYAVVFALTTLRQSVPEPSDPGPAFSVKTAIILAGMISAMVLLSAACEAWLGRGGVVLAAILSGFADTHAAAVSVASLEASGRLAAASAVVPVLAAFTANTVSKIVVAVVAGGWGFALRIVPGLLLILGGAWIGLLVRA
jgi:uncharacterized membrane protein (DUF4010 family)